MVLFDAVLEGIKTILENDANTKDIIRTFRKYDTLESGSAKTPICVIGPVLDADLLAEYVGTCHHFSVPIGIQLLDRSYPAPLSHQKIMDVLDQLQNDVCAAIVADHKLSDTVLDSSISGLRYIRPSDEWVGYVVIVLVKTNVE